MEREKAAQRTAGRLASSSLKVRLRELSPPSVRIANVDVAHEEIDPITVRQSACSRCAKPLAKFLQCVIGLVVKVNDRAVAIQLL